jgi:DNA-binding response OmpR family regulator
MRILEAALDAGVDDYVLKPLNPADLVMRCRIADRKGEWLAESRIWSTLSD